MKILWFVKQGIYSGNGPITLQMLHEASVIIDGNRVIKNRFGKPFGFATDEEIFVTDEEISKLSALTLDEQRTFFESLK